MSDPQFERELEKLVLDEIGISVDDPTLRMDLIHGIAENLANTPGTFSHAMREAERFEATWGAMDDEEE